MNSWPVQKRLTPLGHGGHPNVNMSHLEVTHAFQQLLHMINQENGKQSFLAVRKWWKSPTPKLLAFCRKGSELKHQTLQVPPDFHGFPPFSRFPSSSYGLVWFVQRLVKKVFNVPSQKLNWTLKLQSGFVSENKANVAFHVPVKRAFHSPRWKPFQDLPRNH